MNTIELTTTAQLIVSQFNVTVRFANRHSSQDDSAFTVYIDNDRYSISLPCTSNEYKEEALSWLRGYLDHEIGHVLYTDFRGMLERASAAADAILAPNNDALMSTSSLGSLHQYLRHLWGDCHNIIEDGRIEMVMARAYPGSRGNLRWLNDKLFTPQKLHSYLRAIPCMSARDMATRCNKSVATDREYMMHDIAAFCTVVLHVMRWHIYHGEQLSPDMEDALHRVRQDSFYQQALDIARDAARTVTPEDAYELTDRMLRAVLHIAAEHAENMNAPDGAADILEGKGTDHAESMDAFDKAKVNSILNAAQAASRVAVQDNDMAGRTFNALKGNKDDASLTTGRSSRTTTVLYELSEVFEKFYHGENETMTIKDQDALRAINDVKYQAYSVLSSTLQTVTFRRSRTGSMGTRLDGRFLARPSYGDGRIFTRKAERIALDTNVSVVLDMSGSMAAFDDNGKTNAQLATVVAQGMMSALRMLPHVTATLIGYNGSSVCKLKEGEYMSPDCTTPTGGAMQFAYMDHVKNSPKARQIMFLVTDGVPDSTDTAIQIAQWVRSKDVDLYGISIGGAHATPRIVGEENCMVLMNLKDFASDFSRMMRRAFIRRAA